MEMLFNNIFGAKNKHVGERGEELLFKNDGFPDSRLPHGLCSRCNKQSSFDIISSTPISFSGTVCDCPLISEPLDQKYLSHL